MINDCQPKPELFGGFEYEGMGKDQIKWNDIDKTSFNMFPMQSLNEISVKRFLNVHYKNGFIVISACRSDWSINQKENRELNNKKTKELEGAIVNREFSYIPVFGGYKEKVDFSEPSEEQVLSLEANNNEEMPIGDNLYIGLVDNLPLLYYKEDVYEQSFVVLNFDRKGNKIEFQELYNFAIWVANEYKQDSMLVKSPNGTPQYINKSGGVDMEFTGDIKINDMSENYFTDFIKTMKLRNNSKDHRITFESFYIKPKSGCYSERHIRYLKGEIVLGD